MTRGVLGRIVLGVWLAGVTVAAVQLPPEVLVDKYLLQAQMLSDEQDHKGALEAMDRIVALQEEHNLTLPEAFSFYYAQTALAAGSVQAAIDAVIRYLAVAGREGKYYREALDLLVNAERKLQKLAPDPVRSTLAKPEINPQHQAVRQSSPPVQKTTAVQPAVDCRKWNTKKFFRKATVEEVAACLAAGADPMAQTKRRNTPLHWAAQYNQNPAVIEVLLKWGADVDARDKWEYTPLHWAAFNENSKMVVALIKGGADPNALGSSQRKDKWTPLHRAAQMNENPEVVKALIDAGANLNVHTILSESTPLHFAAEYNDNPEVVKALIDAGADQTVWNKKRKTPLQAARRRHRKILRNAWASLSGRQKATHQARVRRKKAPSGPSFLDFAIGTAGGVAIAAAGGGNEEAVDAGTVFAEGVISGQQPVGSSGGGISSTPTGGDGSSSEFDTALRNLENSCGERYRSAFSDQDHGRFYCLDAFARHCALKKGHNQQQLDALRHDFEVLRSQGQESRCPYFGVLGGTYDENQAIPQMPESVTDEEPTVPVSHKRRLPTCADGQEVPITVAEGRMPGCPPESWCRWDACRNNECRRRYPKCEPGVLQ